MKGLVEELKENLNVEPAEEPEKAEDFRSISWLKTLDEGEYDG